VRVRTSKKKSSFLSIGKGSWPEAGGRRKKLHGQTWQKRAGKGKFQGPRILTNKGNKITSGRAGSILRGQEIHGEKGVPGKQFKSPNENQLVGSLVII